MRNSFDFFPGPFRALILAISSSSAVCCVLRLSFSKIFGLGKRVLIFLDAYYAAFRIPDLLYFTIMSALSTAFIPLYTVKLVMKMNLLFASQVLNGIFWFSRSRGASYLRASLVPL